ncbi:MULTISPECIES: hypothetical protein [unclassified Ensifer]|uniref:hypothetical protein n=1 Tax=unclassified Ensifer TaxID=2633371 RepID=UPI000812F1A1|nr:MULTISPECIES: hypothetical protein [unclassified Ensifer]OCP21917.1 hypothetical protein BC361_25450 [Ensifer sp. LC54]OCP23303.1 hypothetical protein BC363_25315 [Ensifer sp. LC384]
MSDERRVIDLKSRKPFAQARAEETKRRRAATRKAKKETADAIMEHREAVIETLEGMIKMVRAGELEGLVCVMRNPASKLFMTDVVMDDRIIPPNDLHAYVGVIETLKLELADSAAANAPALLIGGEVVDPTMQPADEEWEYE